MNRLRPAPGIFMLAYSVAYAFVFFKDWPLFRYYPLHGDFNWGPRSQTGVGPAMAWYGLMASAFIVALLVSLCVPDRVLNRNLYRYLWTTPLLAMVISVILLRRFLF